MRTAASPPTSLKELIHPWISPGYHNDKLRYRERYRRPYPFHQIKPHLEPSDRRSYSTNTTCNSNPSSTSPSEDHGLRQSNTTYVIPDGPFLRKYLTLLEEFLSTYSTTTATDSAHNQFHAKFQLVLLESSIEIMEYRHSSPCISSNDDTNGNTLYAESTTIDEKSRLLRMCDDYNPTSLSDAAPITVIPFADLTYSTQTRSKHDNDSQEDVFDLLDYKTMSIDARSRCALVRAASSWFATLKSSSLDEMNAQRVIVLTEDELHLASKNAPEYDGFTMMNAQEFLTYLGHELFISIDSMLVHRCEEDYVLRNQPLSSRNMNTESESASDEELGQTLPHDEASLRRRKCVATLPPLKSSFQRDESARLVVPMDPLIPKVRVKTRMSLDTILNHRLLVEIDGWDVDSSYPRGHIVKVIGPIGDLETEIASLLLEHDIELTPFSASALACLPTIDGSEWSIPEAEITSRKDLRTTCRIFSVDPPGCQDIDDAMHAKVLDSGDIEIGVHIADVTHFLVQGSALDKEAARRATTLYLVDRRFDMLPSLLSSDLCSLHGNVDRLAVSVVWVLSPDLKTVKSTWYGRTVIHNVQAMTYDQAHNILHDREPDDPTKLPPPLTAGRPVDRSIVPELKADLTILTKLARKLRKDREDIGGAVDLSSGDRGSEVKFILGDDGKPTKALPKTEMEIHHTIAELMIMANGFVGKTIYEHFPRSSLLRIHRSVETDRFEDLSAMLEAGGFSFDGNDNRALARTLADAKKTNKYMRYGSAVDALFQTLATRAMSEAQYICTGTQDAESVGLSHYGLGIEHYTHFTSPIRRFCDIIVHRLLLDTKARSNTGPYLQNEVTKLCERLNEQNRKAKHSSIECQKLYLSLFFEDNTDTVSAVVVRLLENGMIVYIPKYDIKGPVYFYDRNGKLQLDTSVLEYNGTDGVPPTFKPLDVCNVQITCDISETVRIPSPRFRLVSGKKDEITKDKRTTIDSRIIQRSRDENESTSDDTTPVMVEQYKSMFQLIGAVEIRPELPNTAPRHSNDKDRAAKVNCKRSVPGRLIFGGFKSKKDVPSRNLIEEKESSYTSYDDSYNRTISIEREVTARIQRLAASKRNAKYK